jgi:hypothetical protein
VKFSRSLAALALAAALALPIGASLAAGPELKIPDFSHLRGKAVDSTDITIDGFLMRSTPTMPIQRLMSTASASSSAGPAGAPSYTWRNANRGKTWTST